MGQTKSSLPNHQLLLSHYPQNWFTVKSLHYCEILRNKSTHQLAEEYLVPIQNQQSLSLQVYQYRKDQSDHLVSTLQLQKLQNKSVCSNVIALKVLTERIPYRISNVRQLSVSEALYVIKACLLGFRKIYQHQGPLLIDQQMIGFNESGVVKVWLNTNFGTNERSLINKKYLNTNKGNPENSYQNQMNMIQTIFSMVLVKLPVEVEGQIRSRIKDINGFFNSLNWVDDCAESMGIPIATSVSQRAFKNRQQGYEGSSSRVKGERRDRQSSLVRMSPSTNSRKSVNKQLSSSRQKTKDSSTSSSSLLNRQCHISTHPHCNSSEYKLYYKSAGNSRVVNKPPVPTIPRPFH